MIKLCSNWLRLYKIHLIVWTIFITYETVVIGLIFDVFGNPITYFFHYIVIVSFFYACANWGLPWALIRSAKAWWRFPLLFAISISLYIGLQYGADVLLKEIGAISSDEDLKLSSQFALKNLYRGTYFLGFSVGYYLLKINNLERREQERLKQLNYENLIRRQDAEKELSLTQNAFLKAQINPHFLFNTLDFIYHSIHSSPDAASDAVLHLARMMRFAIDAGDQGEFIYVSEEITHVQTLIDLYRLRKNDIYLPVILDSPKIQHLQIIPLIILTLAENMLKHGLFTSDKFQSYMSFSIEQSFFIIETMNAVDRQTKRPISGAGLKNIEGRLKFIYSDLVEFNAGENDDGFFLVKIKIPTIMMISA